ncbi:hypothetical protein PR002_g7081, partial [Phytophthora rubi]
MESTSTSGGTGTKKVKTGKRFKWSNDMIADLLRLRFTDSDVKHRLEAAQTKTQTALAWQYFVSVLSQSQGVVITREQVSQKYRKLKCIYRKEKREAGQTGNCARELREIDDALWGILHDAFSGRVGISGEVLLDSHLDDDEGDSSGADQGTGGTPGTRVDETIATAGKGKVSPVESLGAAMRTGMEAIAASLTARASSDGLIESLTAALQRQHDETRRFQALQLQLLQQLVKKDTP